MAPSFLTFFDPGQIEPATAFSSTLVVHTLCLEQLNGYTHYSSLCTSLCTHVLESHFPPSPQLFGHSPKPATDSFHCYILVRTPIGPNVWLIVLIPAQASYLTKPVCEDSYCKWHFPPTPQLFGHSPKPCSQSQPITEEL